MFKPPPFDQGDQNWAGENNWGRQQGSGKVSRKSKQNKIRTGIEPDQDRSLQMIPRPKISRPKDPKIDNLKTDERSKNDVTQDEEEKYAICETIVRAGAGGTADGSGHPGTDPSFNR
jgi:hypothetical protein